MTFQEYLETNRKAKVKSDAVERWEGRVIPRGLHQLGLAGAQQYLADYGRGIAAPKCIQLALKAEMEGCFEMALGFWLKAYELETGSQANPGEYKAPDGAAVTTATIKVAAKAPALPSSFPKHLQPGHLITMQPVDAPESRKFYIDDPAFLGQPKRDGIRTVVFVENGQVSYQSRSMKLRSSPSPLLDEAFLAAAATIENSSYILDGELTYLDWRGMEHRTGAQAAQVNMDEGHGEIQPEIRYCIFEAIAFGPTDLTNHPKELRIRIANAIYGEILSADPESRNSSLIEMLPTALTQTEKAALAQKQQREGREGEVWTLKNAKYSGGKATGSLSGVTVRTKYLANWDLVVTGLAPTTAAGRPFGAIEVAKCEKDGTLTPMGSVGTGYTMEEMDEIATRFAAGGAPLMIKVISQGLTEKGQLWHARFDGFADEA
jgi:ATP dependent DNA ligase domain.